MKKWLLPVYMGVLCFVVTACTNYIEDTSLQPSETNEIQVTFKLEMGNPVRGSRAMASWEENQESEKDAVPGNNYENKIDLNTLQVLVYSVEDDSYMGEIKRIKYINAEAEGNVYELFGELSVDESQLINGRLNCKIMVFANGAKVSPESELSALSYSYNADAYWAGTQLIPMWGTKKYSNLELKTDERVNLQTISLLRALAKVEVRLSDEAAEKFSLTDVSINKYNSQGFCLPAGYAAATDTKELDMESVFNVFPSSGEGFLAFKAIGINDYIIYLPEYAPVDATELAMNISLFRKNGTMAEVKDPHVYFKDYASGTPINMVRNHYYQFNITHVDDHNGLTLDFLALPWDGEINIDVPTFN